MSAYCATPTPFAAPERVKSTHKAEVVPVVLEPHPDADTLSVVRVGGYSVCARTNDWQGVDRAVYVVPDSVVDTRRPEFSFLADKAKADGSYRVRAMRLRGVLSEGLLVPAPAGAELGEDLAGRLGVTRYEPDEEGETKEKFVTGGEQESGPDLDTGPAKYDVDALKGNMGVFADGEPVFVSEKLDGSNARFVFWDGRFWVKSRNHWVKRVPDYSHVTVEGLVAKGMDVEVAKGVVDRLSKKAKAVNGFWQAMEACTALQEYLVANPGTVVFGEVYGTTARLKYGLPDGNRFAAFDIYRDGRFLDVDECLSLAYLHGLPWVPSIGGDFPDEQSPALHSAIRYSFDAVKKLSEGKTTAEHAKAGVIREGVVVKPLVERWDRKVGRVILKCVNPEFLSKG